MPERKKTFEAVVKFDETDDTLLVAISTDKVDRDSEVLIPSGVDLENYRKNPVVMWGHDWHGGPGSVIGKALWVKAKGNQVLAKIKFAAHETAQLVMSLYRDKFLHTFSVGFIPGQGHAPTEADLRKHPDWVSARHIHDTWELLEFSAVPIPSNPDALALAMAKGLRVPEAVADEVKAATIIVADVDEDGVEADPVAVEVEDVAEVVDEVAPEPESDVTPEPEAAPQGKAAPEVIDPRLDPEILEPVVVRVPEPIELIPAVKPKERAAPVVVTTQEKIEADANAKSRGRVIAD